MKNLKKVLSLVLALAMALSLMTAAFAADASDYKDYSKVTYKEAVDVMTAAGIFNGGDGNNFNPDATLNREQAAKIITYMLVGQDAADKLTASIAPYADVAATRWSAGSIAYCTNEGIIAGDGNGRFNPTDPVTGTQFAKMLLVALGYDPQIEQLVGNSWAINVSKLALGDADLDDGMEEIALSVNLTREQAAQMAFNAMQATLVEYEDNGGKIELPGGIVIVTDPSKATPVTSKVKADATNISDDTVVMNGGDVYTVEFAEKYCKDLKLKSSTGHMMQLTDKWSYKSATIGEYMTAPDAVAVVDDTDKTINDILTGSSYMDYSSSDIALAENAEGDDGSKYIYINGVEQNNLNKELTQGDVVYAYENNDGDVAKVVVAHYTYAKIDSISDNMSTSEENNGASYRVKLVDIDDNNLGTFYDDYDDTSKELPGFDASTYEEGTVLAVAMNGKKAVASYVADVVTGKPTSVKEAVNGNITIDGTKYDYAGAPAGNYDNIDFDKEYSVYTTNEGYVIAIDGASAANLEDIYYVTAIYNETTGGEKVYYAQRVSSEGKVDTVEVEQGALEIIADSTTLTNATGASGNISDGKAAAGLYEFSDKKVAETSLGTGTSAEQKSGNEVYTIKPFDASELDDDFDQTVTKLKSDIKATDSTLKTNAGSFYVNDETVYLAVESQGSKIDVTYAVGGLKCTGTPAAYVVTDEDDSKTARLVIFAGDSLSTSASTENIVYLADDAEQKASSDTYTTDDLWLMEDLTNPAGIIITDDNTNQGFYTYSMDGDNYKLEDANDLELNAAYDDEDGYMSGLTIESVYNKSGKAYVTFVDNDSYLDDVKFNGVTIIDTRSESDIDNSAYPTEIISVADLKDAVETPCVVKADVYFDNGVTFLAVTSVDSKGQNAVDQAGDDGYNFVGDITVNDNEVTATGNNSYATVNPSVDASTAPYIADLARFLGGLYRSGSASTIVFDGKTYKWNASGSLKGSNWTENGENDNDTLVKAIDTKWGTVSAGNEYSVTLTVDGVDMTYTVVIPA
ncbi:S-layer homology domain-containing protein [bacterium 210917-DFI.7.65]|nr:S-layer homology domain-containing protein [bacterium 210917-DFI.7.65]